MKESKGGFEKVWRKEEFEQIRARAVNAGQGHLFRWWEELSDSQRASLLEQVAKIDFRQLAELIEVAKSWRRKPPISREVEEAEYIPLPSSAAERAARAEARRIGEAALAQGRVAALMLAGGQGTRLGFDGPKGIFPIGPVSGRTLFQIHADKLRALSRRYGAPIPLYVMTSQATHAPTLAYFEEHDYLGLPKENVRFFQQRMMPTVDLQYRLLLAEKDKLALSPNGHGGALLALEEEGMLEEMERRGITIISCFQVDNPLVHPADPVFIGYHIQKRSEMSNKAIMKRHPEEKLGAFVRIAGRLHVIEYSDLTHEQMHARGKEGRLIYGLGSPAMHLLDVAFVRRLMRGKFALPWHIALKKVPYVDDSGRLVEPKNENAIKFETFIFDALPHAERALVLEDRREDVFSPVKNATGEDSPHTAKRDISALFARWLEEAGIAVPRGEGGHASVSVEVHPLFALDQEELQRRIDPRLRVEGDIFIAE